MGFGIKELVVILVIILLLFGTKKLKNIGTDLGGAIKGFKKSMGDDESTAGDDKPTADKSIESKDGTTITGEATTVTDKNDKQV